MPRRLKGDPLDALLGALANPTRREILDELLKNDAAVGEIATMFNMTRPSVSEHLRILKNTGLINEQQIGRQRIYHITGEPLSDLINWLTPYEHFWRTRLKALGTMLDNMDDDGDQ